MQPINDLILKNTCKWYLNSIDMDSFKKKNQYFVAKNMRDDRGKNVLVLIQNEP